MVNCKFGNGPERLFLYEVYFYIIINTSKQHAKLSCCCEASYSTSMLIFGFHVALLGRIESNAFSIISQSSGLFILRLFALPASSFHLTVKWLPWHAGKVPGIPTKRFLS